MCSYTWTLPSPPFLDKKNFQKEQDNECLYHTKDQSCNPPNGASDNKILKNYSALSIILKLSTHIHTPPHRQTNDTQAHTHTHRHKDTHTNTHTHTHRHTHTQYTSLKLAAFLLVVSCFTRQLWINKHGHLKILGCTLFASYSEIVIALLWKW